MKGSIFVKKPALYLPIETKSREFYGKLLLAFFAAESGYRVLIGSRSVLNFFIKDLPQGIYFYNASCSHNIKILSLAKMCGHKVVVLDEEGLLFQSSEMYIRNRISKDAIKYVDKIFTWGPNQSNIIANEINEKDKVAQVGNCRIDLLHKKLKKIYEKEINNLQNKYGRYILVNSNFSLVNNFFSTQYYLDFDKKFKYINSKHEEVLYNKKLENQDVIFKAFIELISLIANRFPNLNIIIRPHPSESLKGWTDSFSYYKNIHITKEGNVHNWIMGSELVLHNSCTTGIEAFILEKPVISYAPYGLKEEGLDIANDISIQVDSIEKALKEIDFILDEKSNKNEMIQNMQRGKKMQREKKLMKHIMIQDSLCCERIICELKNMDIIDSPPINKITYYRVNRKVNVLKLKYKIAKKLKLDKKSIVYSKNKFPGIVNKDIDIFESYKTALSVTNNIKCKKVTSDFLLIEGEKKRGRNV